MMKYRNICKYIIISVVMFGLIYIMNIYTPMMADDFSYSFSWMTGKRIHGADDVISSMAAHYYKWGGRVITSGLSQIFLMNDKVIFNVINTIAILLLIFLVAYHGKGSLKKLNIHNVLLSFALIFLFTPAFGQSYLWIVGCSTYLYGLVLLLIFLVPYHDIVHKKRKSSIKYILVPIQLVLGFLVGETVENFSVSIVTIMICVFIYCIAFNKSEISYSFSGLIGTIAGCIFLLRAPGTYIRLDQSGQISIMSAIKNFIFIFLYIFQKFGIILLGIIVAVFIIYEQNKAHKQNNKVQIKNILKKYSVEIMFIWGFMAASFSMIVSPERPDRIWSAALIYLIIILFNFWDKIIIKDSDRIKKIFVLCNGVILVIVMSVWINAYFGLKNTYYENKNREYQIYEAKRKGIYEVKLLPIKGYSKYSCFPIEGDLKYDAEQWPNSAIAKYYGVKKIIRIDKD